MKTLHGRDALQASSHLRLGQTRKLPGSRHEKRAFSAGPVYFRRLIGLPCAILLLFSAISAEARTLKLTTWNLEWLTARPAGDPELPQDVTPKQAEDVALLAKYAERVASDVIAIQEVDGPEIAARVFPPDRYVIHMTRDRVVQRVGLVVRRGIDFVVNPDLVALVPAPEARHPLRSGGLDAAGLAAGHGVPGTGPGMERAAVRPLRGVGELRDPGLMLQSVIAVP